jgi:hypothetical protein
MRSSAPQTTMRINFAAMAKEGPPEGAMTTPQLYQQWLDDGRKVHSEEAMGKMALGWHRDGKIESMVYKSGGHRRRFWWPKEVK